MSAAIRARGLLAHHAGGFRDRGLSGTLSFDPAPDSERGLSLGLAHSLGGAASGAADALLARPTLADLGADADGDDLARRSVEARLGLRLSKPAAALETRLEAARPEPAAADGPPENRIALAASARR